MALQHLAPELIPQIVPVLRLRATVRGPIRDAYDFFLELRERAPRGLCVAVDLVELADVTTGLRSPPYDIGEDLAQWGIPMLPVIRLVDSGQRLKQHGTAARLHRDQAILCVRVDDYAAGSRQATAALRRIWRHTGLAAAQCDLLIDCGEVSCPADVDRAEHAVRRIVRWASHQRWNSISVASGAMPPSLAHLPTDHPYPLRRWDAELWQRVAELGIGYSDYGISTPTPRTMPRAPIPTIRYTADDVWWIYRWARRGGRRNDRFYDLCRALVTADHWPAQGAEFSWGDREIARRARYPLGPGSATSWIAWGTSHHLAHVAEWLGSGRAAHHSRAHRAPSPRPSPSPPSPPHAGGGPQPLPPARRMSPLTSGSRTAVRFDIRAGTAHHGGRDVTRSWRRETTSARRSMGERRRRMGPIS